MKEHLEKAKQTKDDEFYTPYNEVLFGVKPHALHFYKKTVYCNCDTKDSQFYEYFKTSFNQLHLKSVIATSIHSDRALIYDGTEEIQVPITDGDYKSPDLYEFIAQCDIICTNPPFSIFRSYFDFIRATGKDFLIIAPLLSTGYANVYPHIRSKSVNISTQKPITFLNGKQIPIVWLTSFPIARPRAMETGVHFDPVVHVKFDNLDAINVDRVKKIPMDYEGVMGVPITFLRHWNPEQFELLDKPVEHDAYVNGVNKFSRIFIKKISCS